MAMGLGTPTQPQPHAASMRPMSPIPQTAMTSTKPHTQAHLKTAMTQTETATAMPPPGQQTLRPFTWTMMAMDLAFHPSRWKPASPTKTM